MEPLRILGFCYGFTLWWEELFSENATILRVWKVNPGMGTVLINQYFSHNNTGHWTMAFQCCSFHVKNEV